MSGKEGLCLLACLSHVVITGDGGGASPTRPKGTKGGRESNSFNKCLLSPYCVLVPGLDAKNTAVNRTRGKNPSSCG